MITRYGLAITYIGLATGVPALAQDIVPAELVGHALLPASSFSPPPPDAPQETHVSGKFLTADMRIDTPLSVPQRTGLSTPFLGQPLQGFSGFASERASDGSLYAVIDNGFGTKLNSTDALLSFARIAPDFATGEISVQDRIWLHDPDRHVPFRIVHEATETRYLTGGDFDPESIQIVESEVWIGEEFGPFLISATLDGRITGVHPTDVDGTEIRSPDHPALRVGAVAGRDYTVPRSGGHEGLALRDGKLWAMLEKPLLREDGEREGPFLRLIEFDPASRTWSGASLKFALTEVAVAIGDINMIDADRALVIERDAGEGDPSLACIDGAGDGCFRRPGG